MSRDLNPSFSRVSVNVYGIWMNGRYQIALFSMKTCEDLGKILLDGNAMDRNFESTPG